MLRLTIILAKPDQNKCLKIAEAYYEQWQFPNSLGEIDGKHVLMQAPPKSVSRFHNYKGTFCNILLACVDANYKFVLVDIGAEGHNSDGGVFKNSIFEQSLEKGTLQLPCPLEILGSSNMLPFLFIEDEAFPLKNNLMRPYPGVALSKDKVIFNYCLSRARRCVENAFGIMASHFRIFQKPLVSSLESSTFTVAAAVCLHNYIKSAEEGLPYCERRYCPLDYADNVSPDGCINDGKWRTEETLAINRLSRTGSKIRSLKIKNFLNYFCHEGQSRARCSHIAKNGKN
ncbi:DDE Tnp4 domain-containing protein [Trichonephila inaurata madagascariensis]|uniref:DDE Tnp4 domain-containing protein n=1 Tax=Trichonephila inaurata madagascariensis TaxID=2747483 RepID=A0A8X7C6C7_9ARAC|nr:DDE Tnp4 domain-containing protein [Trichonephila inaurata madagascariensis]